MNGSCTDASLAIALAWNLRAAVARAKCRSAYLDASVSGDNGIAGLLARSPRYRLARELLLSESVDEETPRHASA